jgi:hypothetical protein
MVRSNPLNIRAEPRGLVVIGIAGAAAIVLGVGGLAVNSRNTAQRVENVRAAVLAAGYGQAAVAPIRGDECWRGREGFTWRSATASGSACAGPRSEVRVFPGTARPHL